MTTCAFRMTRWTTKKQKYMRKIGKFCNISSSQMYACVFLLSKKAVAKYTMREQINKVTATTIRLLLWALIMRRLEGDDIAVRSERGLSDCSAAFVAALPTLRFFDCRYCYFC